MKRILIAVAAQDTMAADAVAGPTLSLSASAGLGLIC